jgi:hypothetical protein
MKFSVIQIFISALLCVTFTAHAQNNATDFTPAHLQAAEKFLLATGINKQFENIADKVISTYGAQMPEDKRAAFAEVMKKFMGKYFTWDMLKDEMSKLYAQEFTEKELKQLADFYNTDTGKKYGEKLPVLTQKGMLIGQQLVVQHQSELQDMMKDAFKTQ